MLIVNDSVATKSLDTVVDKIKRINTAMYKSLKDNHDLSYCMIWSNPDFTASEIISAFGTDAKDLFEVSSMIQNILKKANPEYTNLIVHTSHNIVVNEDGSVLATKIIPVEPESKNIVLGENEVL